MEARLLLKTHYQIGRPGIFSALLKQCASPYQSNYPEVISKRLSEINFQSIALNKESAKFAVTMAQAFGFINQNMFWDWRGHVMNILISEISRKTPDEYLNLSLAEKIIYLKYYLEADGAVILELCKRLPAKKQISRNELLSTPFIDQIFIDVWETYRMISTDLRQKVQLKESIRKLKSKPYTFKTRIHKALSHIEPLIDLDLVERKGGKNEIIFVPKTHDGHANMELLVNELKTIENMEWRFSKSEYFQIISKIYHLDFYRYDPEKHSNSLREEILKAYLKARSQPSQMASIAVLADVISTKFLTQKNVLMEKPQVESELNALKSDYPRDVHFHVDMYGRKAYVVFNNTFGIELN